MSETVEMSPLSRFRLDPSGQHQEPPLVATESIDGRRAVRVWKMPDGFSFAFVGYNREETSIRLSNDALKVAASLVLQLMQNDGQNAATTINYWVATKPEEPATGEPQP